MLTLLYVLLTCMFIMASVLLIWSPGKSKPYRDKKGKLIAGSIQAAARAPELYLGYIGVAQMSNQLNSGRLAYEHMLQHFKENGNIKMVHRLEAAPVTVTGGIPKSYLSMRDAAMHSLGIGTTHKMKSVISGVFVPSFQFRGYTLGEKIDIWRGKFRSGVSSLWSKMITTDLTTKIPELKIPIYFFHGI